MAAERSPAPVEKLNLPAHRGIQLERGAENHLVMPSKVNGRPASFIIDTGAAASFMQADVSPLFGVKVDSGLRSMRVGAKTYPVGVIEDFRSGEMNFGRVPVALYDAAKLGAVPGEKGRHVDGIIGMDLLNRHKAIINCRSRQIFFSLGNGTERRTDLPRVTKALGFTRVSLKRNADGTFMVPCTIAGKSEQLVLDTGAFVTIIDKGIAAEDGAVTRPFRMTARGFDGKARELELGRIDSLRIGGVRIEPQNFVLKEILKPLPRSNRTHTSIDDFMADAFFRYRRKAFVGLLGNDLLDYRHAIIDLESSSLFLK